MTPSTNLTDALPDTTLENPAPAPMPIDADVPRVSLTSPQRIEANRRNAKKSTGPRTEEGPNGPICIESAPRTNMVAAEAQSSGTIAVIFL